METLSKKECDLMVELLLNAKGYICSGRHRYICHAISMAADLRYKNNPKEAHQIYAAEAYLVSWVDGLLDEHCTLEIWLLHKFNINLSDYSANEYVYWMCQTRLAWIDWMIEELRRTT